MHTVGFIYVLSNPAHPGIVKVGKTMKLAEDRAAKLRTTGVPLAFRVEFRAATSWASDVEQRAHALLAAHRITLDREFFAVPPLVAIESIKQALLDVGGIRAWADVDSPYVIRRRDRIALTLEAGQLFVLLSYPCLLATTPEVLDIWQAHADGDLLELMGADAREHVAGLSDGDVDGDQDPVPCLDRFGVVANGALNGRERMVPGERLLWLAPQRDSDACAFCVFDMEDHCQAIGRSWGDMTRRCGSA